MDSSAVLSTSRGWSHLHDLCSGISHPSEAHWEGLLAHIDRFADEAAATDECGRTPLHLLLRHRPPLAVVAALCEAHGEALRRAEDRTGYLPLHVACFAGCSVDVVRFLIERYPHALGQRTLRRHRYRWWEKGLRPRDLVLRLPKTDPNRQHLMEVIDDFEDDIDVEDNRKVRHSRSIWKYDLGWTDRRQRVGLDADDADDAVDPQ